MNAKELKQVVQEKYGQIAKQSMLQKESSCCGTSSCCSSVDYSMINEEYHTLNGYQKEADLGLGCGLPTQFAGIEEGNRVLDLGSGAGNDCFVARAIVGESGQVTGIDFTDAMLEKAEANARKLGYANVNFVKGDIEEMPLPDKQFDVVVSNCVLNLVPDKKKAFAQIMRVLKPNGHFCVSDVVIRGTLPEKLRENAEMYAGCVAGAIDFEAYLQLIKEQGFNNITIHKQKDISIPTNILANYMSPEEVLSFQSGENGIVSITVSGYKN